MTQTKRQQVQQRANRLNLGINLGLVLLKGIAAYGTGSVAILGDVLNNLLDSLTSVIAFLGNRWASEKADREHPFGHARVEYLITLLMAGLMLATSIQIAIASVTAMRHPVSHVFSGLIWLI